MDILTLLLGGFTLASILGAASAVFYSYRSKAIIDILKESNAAYQERNLILEQQNSEMKLAISQLEARISMLEKIKTPSLDKLTTLTIANHTELTTQLGTLIELSKERNAQ